MYGFIVASSCQHPFLACSLSMATGQMTMATGQMTMVTGQRTMVTGQRTLSWTPADSAQHQRASYLRIQRKVRMCVVLHALYVMEDMDGCGVTSSDTQSGKDIRIFRKGYMDTINSPSKGGKNFERLFLSL